MPDKHNRTTEAEISEAILGILSKIASGKAKLTSLTAMVPARISLTAEDRERSGDKVNEEKWEQRLHGITTHRKTAGNYIAEGYLKQVPSGLAITDAGRERAAGKEYPVAQRSEQ